MTLLVTGGAGFIGSNFLRYITAHHPKLRVICVDLLTYAGNTNNISQLIKDEKITFIKEDIRNNKGIEEIFSRYSPDIVVNFAAESHVDRAIENPGIFVDTNIKGVWVLLDNCVKHGVKRFHQISTDEVYGDSYTVSNPATEKSLLIPSGPYSASKASADMLTLSYGRTFSLNISISRSPNNFGCNQHREKLIPKIIYNALNNKPIGIYGKGENIRGWLHTKNHSRAIEEIIFSDDTAGEIFNIPCERYLSNISLVKMILDIMKKPYSLIEYIPDRKGHDMAYYTSGEKIKASIGYTLSEDFEERLYDAVRYYINEYKK